MNIDKIYNLSPVWLQNLMCSVKGWQIYRRRYSRQFYNELHAYEQGKYEKDVLLRMFLDEVKLVPAYMEIFNKYTNLQGAELLLKFPVITKNEVKMHISDFINPRYKEPQITMKTSGTTGGGMVFPYPTRMENRQWAIWWRYRRRLGISLDFWSGWFGGKRIIDPNDKRAPFWRINKPGKQVMFSSTHLNKDTVVAYHQEIDIRKLPWIHGYPSHIAKFAALALEAELEPLVNVKWVTTGAENLLGNQEKLMQQMFPNAMIRQHYGLMEGVANISQDKDGEWYIDDDFAKVEFIPVSEDNPNICRIIGTGFSNPAFPLIRYDTGDIATVEWKSDGSVKVLSIEGRSNNTLKGPDGFEINEARLSIVLHDFNHIIEAQFRQRSLTDIDLLVVKNRYYNQEDEKLLRANIADSFDKRMNVNIKYVDEIERTKAGKLKFVVSETMI